jgi:mono/diheme cytochrome c family protein
VTAVRLLLSALIVAGICRAAAAQDPDAIARGAYLANAADCVGCHTDKEHGGKP